MPLFSQGTSTQKDERPASATTIDTSSLSNRINLKANIASPTFTGKPVLPRIDSLGILKANGLKLKNLTTVTSTPTYYLTLGSGSDSISVEKSKLRGVVKLKSDTIPFATFGAGSGLVGDSAAMQTGMILGSFYNKSSDTLVVVESRTFMVHGIGLDTMTIQAYFNTTFTTSGATLLTSSVMPIGKVTGTNTALTTGNVVTSFTNPKIPPGYIFWEVGNFPSATRKPQYVLNNIAVYKK